MLFAAIGGNSQDFLNRIKNKTAANIETMVTNRVSEAVTGPLNKNQVAVPLLKAESSHSRSKVIDGSQKGLQAFSKHDLTGEKRSLYPPDVSAEAITEFKGGWTTALNAFPETFIEVNPAYFNTSKRAGENQQAGELPPKQKPTRGALILS